MEKLPPLGVPNDYVAATSLGEHGSGNLAGESAFFAPVHILGGDGHLGAHGLCDGGGNRGERGSEDNVAVLGLAHEGQKLYEKISGGREGLVHLPVPGHHRASFASGHVLSVRACTPGSVAPPKNSSDAPPPVEMWEIPPATPD